MTKQQKEINELKKQVAALQAQVELLNRRPQFAPPCPQYVPYPTYERIGPFWEWNPHYNPVYSLTITGDTK